jgi:hypothetical protein
MDRTLRIAQAILTIVVGLAPLVVPGASWAAVKGTLVLPPGVQVDVTRPHHIAITDDPRNPIDASFQPERTSETPDEPTSTTLSKPAPPDPEQPATSVWMWIVLAILATAAVIGGALSYYYRRYLPRQEIEPYWQALREIRAQNYRVALPQLTGIEAKLPADLRRNARFFIALCHFHLGNESETEHVAADLHRERPADEHVAYVLAYVLVGRGLDVLAEPVLETMQANGQLAFRDARRLLSIVKYRCGMQAFRAGDIDRAATLFAEVEALGDLAAAIPADLRDRHILLGTRALFDRDLTAATDHFTKLEDAAAAMPEAQGKPLRAKAAVGLTLVAWIEDDPQRGDGLEKCLAQTCLSLHADGPLELPWPDPQPGDVRGDADALKRALEEADKNFDLLDEQKDVRRCLRDLHFLRAMEVLRQWQHMDGSKANEAVGVTLRATLARLACARAVDERFADAFLVAGLLMFYLHNPGPERTTGVDFLEVARKLGVRDPEAMEIVNNRERIEQENADAVDRYQQVLDKYLRDDTVRMEVRRDLLNRLSTHRSLMNRYKPPDLTRAHSVPPTVEEMYTRSHTLRQRILEVQKSSENAELKQRGEQLQRQSEEFARQAQALEASESELLAMTGAELFKDR